MTKKVLLTFLVIWLFSNTGSAQILKNTWIINYFGRGMLLSGNYWEYFSIIGVTLLVIFILRWAMKRREKIREERRKKQDASERRTLRNDNIS